MRNLPPSLQFLNLNRNSPLKIHYGDTCFPPDAAVRNSQAPILFKCCRVDYNKEANRLEIFKGDYVAKVVILQRLDIDPTEYDDIVVETTDKTDFKQLLDEVFVISRIIKVEVRVISRSRRLRLITLTETLIILDITKTESNNCFIIH